MAQTLVESLFLTALWVNLKGIITVRRSETKLLMQVISFDHNCINYYIIFIFFMPSFWQTSIHFMHFDKSNEMDSIIRCKYKWVFSVLRLQFLPKFWTFSKHYQLQVKSPLWNVSMRFQWQVDQLKFKQQLLIFSKQLQFWF